MNRQVEFAVFCITAALVLLAAHLIFGPFFPGPNGLGHDYAGGLPGLLADYYWSSQAGKWSVPWFTPAFCGGIPWFADPGSGYFSLPSLLVRTFSFGPTDAFYGTFLIFIFLGFSGMYLVARSMRLSIWAALFAATVFGLNGFHSSRMLIGHTGFHGFMLVPWLAWTLTFRGRPVCRDLSSWLGAAALGGVVVAYWIHSGMGSLLLPLLIASGVLILVTLLRGASFRALLQRGLAAALIGVLLTASKLVASSAYLGNFPREGYLLPGFSSAFDAISFGFISLFFNDPAVSKWILGRLENLQWTLERQELEFGVTWIPLISILFASGRWLTRGASDKSAHPSEEAFRGFSDREGDRGWRNFYLVSLMFLLVLPLALNTFEPTWNAFLKSLPLIGSSSSLIRWYLVYIPVTVLVAAISLDYFSGQEEVRRMIAIALIAVFVFIVQQVDRSFYRDQGYSPQPIEEAFKIARATPDFKPRITHVGAFVNPRGEVQLTLNRNDLLAQGVSQFACYVPIFGYRLEWFPFSTLRPGPSLSEQNGKLNVKNPSCFVFPEENSCQPGDHFSIADRAVAERFLSYQEISFEKSAKQKLADWLTLIGISLVILMVSLALVLYIRE